MTKGQIENIFTYHKPSGTQQDRYQFIRVLGKELAEAIRCNTPESRERSLAFTAVQQAVMWANAAIAVNENQPTLAHDPHSGV